MTELAAAPIGNTRTLALVAPDGTVAFLALPAASDPPIFYADAPLPALPGHFRLAAHEPTAVTREYVGDTAVLRTVYETATGKANVVDFLPVRPGPTGEPRVPYPRLVRLVECMEGQVSFAFEVEPAGQRELETDTNGMVFKGARDALILQTDAEVHPHRHSLHGHFTLRAAERRRFVLTQVADPDPDVPAMQVTEPEWDIDGTYDFWLMWARRCAFQGVQRDYVTKLAARVKAAWVPPADAVMPVPIYARHHAAFEAVAPVALAAWGWTEDLPGLLAGWPGLPVATDSPLAACELFAWLAEGNRSGLLELNDLPAHWAGWRAVAERILARTSAEEPASVARGLAGAAMLADELMLDGDKQAWQARADEILGKRAERPRVEDAEFEQWLAAGALAEAVEAIEAELDQGAYLQARRRMDRWLLAYDPLSPRRDMFTDARALWLAARVYLLEPPTPARVHMPGDLGE